MGGAKANLLQGTLDLLILRAGSYTLFCSLPEHESKGMRATLFVQ